MRILSAFVAGVVLVCSSLPSVAAEKHDHAKRGTNGGEVADAGPYHLELVVKDQAIALYVLDEKNRKVAVDSAKATATVMSGGGRTTVSLTPAGDNVLKGSGKFQSKEDMRVLVSISIGGKEAQQARFTPLHKEGGDHKGHKH